MIRFSRFFRFFCILLCFIFFFLFSAYSYANSVQSDLSQSFLRLHIVANSDSKEDQDLKYLVRDNLLTYMSNLCQEAPSKEEALNIASSHLNDFEEIAKQTIQDAGFSYPVKVEIGNFSFPTKNYGNFSLPAGYYDALKVSIGSAQGQNWWCVMFPPLCFVEPTIGVVEEETVEQIQSELSEEEFAIITSEDSGSSSIRFKFKLIELMENMDTHFFTQD